MVQEQPIAFNAEHPEDDPEVMKVAFWNVAGIVNRLINKLEIEGRSDLLDVETDRFRRMFTMAYLRELAKAMNLATFRHETRRKKVAKIAAMCPSKRGKLGLENPEWGTPAMNARIAANRERFG